MMGTQERTFGEQRDCERHLPLEGRTGPCQVRIETGNPCPYPAVVEIRGVPFCGRCAREQEAYFVIGELTQPGALDEELLAKALEDLKRERRRGGTSGVSETRNATHGRHAVLGAR